MCFTPQRRALFPHLNFQKPSDTEVFCKFWLRNVLRATTACTFSTSQLPKVVRSSCALYILIWKCASRHNGVQFFISPLASWLRTRRFSEPTFRPSRATNHWKNTVFRDFPTFSRICIFFLLTLSLLLFFLLIFLFSLHIVGSLTSKLPSSTLTTLHVFNIYRAYHTFQWYHTYHTYKKYQLWPYIPYLSYLSCIPHIPYVWNIITTPPIHTIPNIHAIHTIPALHSKHSIPIIVTKKHTIQTIHTVISNIPYPTGLHTILTIHTVPHPHHTTGGGGGQYYCMADPWLWQGGLERWTI